MRIGLLKTAAIGDTLLLSGMLSDVRRAHPSATIVFISGPDNAGAAALLPDRRVRVESTLPPEILLAGARHSQDVKCLAFGQAERSVPHSPISFSASEGPRP